MESRLHGFKGMLLAGACLAGVLAAGSARAQKFDGLAATPQMGWNSWNKFACNIDEKLIRETADAMLKLGLKDAGYQYINIDDCWHGKRDADGNMHPDPERFPSGIRALADYVHARGLKLGIYSDVGATTCGGRPGSRGHEYQDARTYAAWGVDYLKYDWCDSKGLNAVGAYTTMRDAIRAAGRPMLLSICEWGDNKPWEWAPEVGHSWRTTGDITPCWDCEKSHGSWSALGVLRILDKQAGLRKYAGPGHWNDMDMLEVGMGMTESEDRAHFSIWAMMASPLILGNDLRAMPASTRQIVGNREVIAINQDPLGVQALRFYNQGQVELWAKPMANDEWAFMVLNRGDAPLAYRHDWKQQQFGDDLSQREADFNKTAYRWTDVWSGKTGDTSRPLEVAVPAHGVALLRLRKAGSVSNAGHTMRADDPRVVRMGRTVATPGGALRFGYAGVTLRVAFEGTRLAMEGASMGNSVLEVVVDGGQPSVLRLGMSNGPVELVGKAAPGRHTVELVHRTETWLGDPQIRGFATDGAFVAPPPLPPRKLLVLGDSVTCGANMERPSGDKNDPMWWNARLSYGMLVARDMQAQVQLVCYGGRGLVRSWNGRTDEVQLPAFYDLALPVTVADASYTLKWNQADYHPDLILVAIGTNDFTTGMPEHAAYVSGYAAFVRTLLRDHPQAQIVLTEGAILDGEKKAALTAWLNEVVLTSGSANVHYVKSLHHPGDERDMHPTTAQHAAMARELAPQLRPYLH